MWRSIDLLINLIIYSIVQNSNEVKINIRTNINVNNSQVYTYMAQVWPTMPQCHSATVPQCHGATVLQSGWDSGGICTGFHIRCAMNYSNTSHARICGHMAASSTHGRFSEISWTLSFTIQSLFSCL